MKLAILTFALCIAPLRMVHAAGPDWDTGYATNFEGMGWQGGGCGVPDEVLWNEAKDTLTGQGNPFEYVALNVFNTPNNYSEEKVLVDSKGNTPAAIMGTWEDGLNCGRWVEVEMGDSCNGIMDGHPGQAFCRDGKGWFPDSRNGARLNLIVADRCGDPNAWCRDSRYHLDIHSWALNHFKKDGQLILPLLSQVFSGGQPVTHPDNRLAFKFDFGSNAINRKISWHYVPAPNYQGEPRFYFKSGAKAYYRPLIITHLPNGLHKVEQDMGNGTWKALERVQGAWQAFRMEEVMPFRVRLYDVDDQLIMGGRIWTFDFPGSCGGGCSATGTPVDNLKGEGGSVGNVPALHPQAPKFTQAGGALRIRFDGTDGRFELMDISGRIHARGDVRSGVAVLPGIPSGVHWVRWNVDGVEGIAKVPVL